jgi:apolipoprotein N-acyltransferase
VVVVGVALSSLFDGKKATRGSALTVGVAFGALLFVGSLAALAPRGEVLRTIEVAVVQGGGPQRTRATATGAAVVFANQLAANQQVATPVDLVLWPENVVNPSPDPGDGSRLASRLYQDEAHQALTAEAQRLNAVLIPGWFHQDPGRPDANLNYSTAVENDGTIADRYDKVRTVPFGEFVPLRSLIEPLAANMLPTRDVHPGRDPAILDTSLGRLGISVSWEIFFAHRARDAIGNGGQILLNPTNGASYWLTLVQTQQVASSQLRALETGRWVLQAAPTGFSAIINPQGQVQQRTAVSEQAVLHATVELRQGQTWATQVGVWPLLILSVFLILWGHRKPEATPTGAEQ